MRRDIAIIAVLGIVFVSAPLFWERLHSDEVIYWEVAKNLSQGVGLTSETRSGETFLWHMPLAFFIVAPFLGIEDHIFTARFAASLFTVASAVLIYMAGLKVSRRDEALAGAVLFLFSFHALRFGARFYLDQFGLLFFLLSLLLLLSDRPLSAGVPALLSIFAREYWLGVYPFFFLVLRKDLKRALRFGAPAVAAAAGLFFFLIATGKTGVFLSSLVSGTSLIKNIAASLSEPGLVRASLRGWFEFALIDFFILAGFVCRMVEDRSSRWYLALVIPQLAVLTMIHGFILNGAVTQYPMALAGTMAVYSGSGLKTLYEGMRRRLGIKGPSFVAAAACVVMLQYVGFNIMATAVSLHSNPTIYALGYSDDRKVISLLRRKAAGEFIFGIHGAFVPERRRWDWTDFYIEDALEKDPDWLITFSNYIELLPEDRWRGRVVVREIGPYLVLHALVPGALKDAVKAKAFPKWALRRR